MTIIISFFLFRFLFSLIPTYCKLNVRFFPSKVNMFERILQFFFLFLVLRFLFYFATYVKSFNFHSFFFLFFPHCFARLCYVYCIISCYRNLFKRILLWPLPQSYIYIYINSFWWQYFFKHFSSLVKNQFIVK